LLTGWLGGPAAARRTEHSDLSILKESILSLSSIFKIDAGTLEKELVHYRVINWQRNPNVRGGYSYNTLGSKQAKKILAEPVAGKVFFSGEALYEGAAQGTVEAALQSGIAVAKK
jgi:monoamine oxidase